MPNVYYLFKILQGLGLAVIAAGFVAAFPEIMNMRALAAGLLIFLLGWAMERFGLRR